MNTPRTNAVKFRIKDSDHFAVHVVYACKLETELQTMTSLADRLAEALETCRFKDWFKAQETGQISVVLDAGKVREALAAYETHKKGKTPAPCTKKPCDCIEKCGKYWVQRCDCQNNTSLAEAQSWCDDENKKANTP